MTRWPLRHAGQERDQPARGGVGVVEVLQQQGNGLSLAEPLQEPQHGLVHARLAPLGGGDARPVGQQLQLLEPRAQTRHQPGDGVARGAHQRRERRRRGAARADARARR